MYTSRVSALFSTVLIRLNGSTAGRMSGMMTSALPYQNHTPMVRFAATAPMVATTQPASRPMMAPANVCLWA